MSLTNCLQEGWVQSVGDDGFSDTAQKIFEASTDNIDVINFAQVWSSFSFQQSLLELLHGFLIAIETS